MTFAREAWPFVVPFLLAAGVVAATGRWRWGLLIGVAGIAVLLFFRVPRRVSNAAEEVLLAPANGLITAVERLSDPTISEVPLIRIVTFLSVFDVHVQRAPAKGKVLWSRLRRGRKIAAFKPEAGEVNETRTTVFELPSEDVIAIRQIAGLLARRVVGYVEAGDTVERGDLIGVIKFGSRVDLLVPETFSVLVTKGQRVQEGLTPMARRQEGVS